MRNSSGGARHVVRYAFRNPSHSPRKFLRNQSLTGCGDALYHTGVSQRYITSTASGGPPGGMARPPKGRLALSTLNQHLLRRGAIYHYRRRLPAPLKEILSRTHFDGSLETADPSRARPLARQPSVAMDPPATPLQPLPPPP